MCDLYGPRPVTQKGRKLCLPPRLAKRLRVGPGSYVRVAASTQRPGELEVRRANSRTASRGSRDAGRARRIWSTGQFSLPAPLMEQVGLRGEHRLVYLAFEPEQSAIRVIPAGLLRWREEGIAG